MSMYLNNCVDSAVKNNWSAFVQSTVEIKIPWQLPDLVQDNSHVLHRKYVYVQMNTRSNSYLENLMATSSMYVFLIVVLELIFFI